MNFLDPSSSSASLLVQDSALGLLMLTAAVTPANIFMYTHGAKLPMAGPDVPVTFHYVRAALQSILFAQFFTLAEPTIRTII